MPDDLRADAWGDEDVLRCRCYGIDKRTRCERDATQEDGYCNACRCPHGACDSHWEEGTWSPELFFEDPEAFMDGLMDAAARANRCAGLKIEWRVRQDELRDGTEVQDEEVTEGSS